MKTQRADNPLTGAGILRYFNEEKGIKVDPQVFIGITIAFIVFELLLKVV
jgi:preprotein translocase subunit Sec61beta